MLTTSNLSGKFLRNMFFRLFDHFEHNKVITEQMEQNLYLWVIIQNKTLTFKKAEFFELIGRLIRHLIQMQTRRYLEHFHQG